MLIIMWYTLSWDIMTVMQIVAFVMYMEIILRAPKCNGLYSFDNPLR